MNIQVAQIAFIAFYRECPFLWPYLCWTLPSDSKINPDKHFLLSFKVYYDKKHKKNYL